MTDRSPTRPALQPWPRWILFGWLGLLVVLAIMLVGSNSDSTWQDLVMVLALMFVILGVVVLIMTWAVARFLFSDPGPRTAVVLLGPPILVGIALLLIWVI